MDEIRDFGNWIEEVRFRRQVSVNPFLPLKELRALLAISCIPLARATGASDAAPPHPIPVEVWSGGDDGLTQRLRDAVERAFQASPDFAMSFGNRPGTLVVTVPTHVKWQNLDDKTLVRYTIEFSSASGQRLDRRKGRCWDNEYSKCAGRILGDARTAARRIRR